MLISTLFWLLITEFGDKNAENAFPSYLSYVVSIRPQQKTHSTIKVPPTDHQFCQTKFASGAGSKLVACNRQQAEFELCVVVMCILK